MVASLQNSNLLALLANIVHLYYLEAPENAAKLAYPAFTFVVTQLLNGILNSLSQAGGAFTQWHELLGWFSPGKDRLQHENLPLIKKQIHLLWNHRIVKLLLGDNLKELAVGYETIDYPIPSGNSTGNLLKRALTFERSSMKGQPNKAGKMYRKLGCAEVSRVALTCSMYHAALSALSQLRLDILSGEDASVKARGGGKWTFANCFCFHLSQAFATMTPCCTICGCCWDRLDRIVG